MASPPAIYAVCSDRHRNGKTLLARVLVDFLLLEDRDPFAIDAAPREGLLRASFPGRTALVDLDDIRGQMKLFDTILGSPGRDYVIDLPAAATPRFCEAAIELNFVAEARKLGFVFVVLFIVDKEQDSLGSARTVEEILAPDLFIPVRNALVGSAYRASPTQIVIDMPELEPALQEIIANKRFSFRSFMQGEESAVPYAYRGSLQAFLNRLTTGFREIGPALSFASLRSQRR